MNTTTRRWGLAATGVLAAVLIAIPVLGAGPSASPTPPGQAKPDTSEKPEKSEKPDKAAKGPEVDVTVTGKVSQATDDDGNPTFSISAGGTTWQLSAGPPWFWGDKNPLLAYVGKSVTVAGSHRNGETELDVETVDGTAIRDEGKPPWAGGPWVVGPTHPGWKPWMADGKPGNGHGRDGAPGQAKDKTQVDDDPDDASGD
jgi:hypothetical protein